MTEKTLYPFSTALNMINFEGKRMARLGWNGTGMFVFLVPGSEFYVTRPPLLGIYEEGTKVRYRPHIDLRAADGSIGPWTPSGADLAATDWFEVR